MIALRLLRICLHIFLGLLICSLVFPWVSAKVRRRCIQDWSFRLLGILHIQPEIIDATNADRSHVYRLERDLVKGQDQPRVVVANHVSWVDIFLINAMQPCRFVAKSDIRDWPLLGYMCAQAETIFIARGRMRDVRNTFKNLVASIEAGERVAFFPEGTTAAQGGLLPFHANLFEAAIDAGAPVRPLALRYVCSHNELAASVEYIGETSFAQSLMRVLRGPALRAQIILLPLVASESTDRRALAAATYDSIRAALTSAQ